MVIHENRVLTCECKRQPPISADPYGPMSLKVSMEWVQAVTRSVHIPRVAGHVQRGEQDSEPLRTRGLNSSPRSGFGKKLQPLMPVVPNRSYSG
jgi:hypothetical protein